MHPPSVRDGQYLGEGAFKLVYASTRNGARVAVATGRHRTPWKEIVVMIVLTHAHPHPHLLPLIAVERCAWTSARMVLPLARFGSLVDLQDMLEFEGCECAFTKSHLRAVLEQVGGAVAHLRALQLRHLDVASRNVLVFQFESDAYRQLVDTKLSDFGSVIRSTLHVDPWVQLEVLQDEITSLFPHLGLQE